jgi:large subunit ribosomal protein L25
MGRFFKFLRSHEMKSVSLAAFPRSLSRRKGVRQVRATGRIPAVIYGGQTKPETLEIAAKEMEDLIHHSVSENVLVDLSVDGVKGKRLALVQEIQHHALTQKILHVDLHEVKEDEKVTIMAAVESTGEPVGVKTSGGTLEHVLFKLKVKALPKDLPEVITVDVSALDIGKAIHIGDIQPPPGVEIMGDKKITVFSVAAPLTEAQEAAALAAEGGAAQPEMLKEKKEEGAAAAPAAGDKAAAGKAGEKAPAAAEKGAEKKPAEKKK